MLFRSGMQSTPTFESLAAHAPRSSDASDGTHSLDIMSGDDEAEEQPPAHCCKVSTYAYKELCVDFGALEDVTRQDCT